MFVQELAHWAGENGQDAASPYGLLQIIVTQHRLSPATLNIWIRGKQPPVHLIVPIGCEKSVKASWQRILLHVHWARISTFVDAATYEDQLVDHHLLLCGLMCTEYGTAGEGEAWRTEARTETPTSCLRFDGHIPTRQPQTAAG